MCVTYTVVLFQEYKNVHALHQVQSLGKGTKPLRLTTWLAQIVTLLQVAGHY